MRVGVGSGGAGGGSRLGAVVGMVITCGADVPGNPDDPDGDQFAKGRETCPNELRRLLLIYWALCPGFRSRFGSHLFTSLTLKQNTYHTHTENIALSKNKQT